MFFFIISYAECLYVSENNSIRLNYVAIRGIKMILTLYGSIKHQCHHTHHVQPDAHRFGRVSADM